MLVQPSVSPMTGIGDLDAAKLQLAEMQIELARARDAQIALQLSLQELGDHDCCIADVAEAIELELLQEQMNNLLSVINSAENNQAALQVADAEEASQAASLQLASALEAQERWDATVLRPHDGALARAIAACDEYEWQERGEHIENPLDLSRRPQEPAAAGVTFATNSRLRCVAGTSSHNSSNRFHLGASSSSSSSRHARGHAAPSSSGSDAAARHRSQVGAGSSSSSSEPAGPQVQCGICFESHAASTMLSAYLPPDAACSSSSTGRCPHLYCSGCMEGYVRSRVQERKYPIHCPDPGCVLELGVSDVMGLLAHHPEELRVFEYLIAEHLIETSRRVYCPYKDCSALLERPDPEEEMVDDSGNQQAPYECPCCKRQFCLSCGITGWHAGLTCKDFQALPPEQRSAEDAAVHHIARSKQWKRCPAPGCGHMVERIEGCNHMRCICNCSFCYACGTQYRNTRPTADNMHGTPGCNCALFVVPEEDADDQQDQQQAQPAVVLHQADRRPRPWRNGRFVSRTRCRHSASINDCPNGPLRCWFWHDEDEQAA